MAVPWWAWAAVLGVIVVMLAVDLFAHRKAHVVGVREAAAWSGLWVALGVAFGAVVWWVWGAEFAAQYYAGYVIEKSLAVDNVFVSPIIFGYFAVPREYQHRVLFYGVLGALVFRAVFIAAGSVLIASFAWILYVFGAFLRPDRHPDGAPPRRDASTLEHSMVLRLFRRYCRSPTSYHGQRFLIRRRAVDGSPHRCWPCWSWWRSPTSSSPSIRSPRSSP